MRLSKASATAAAPDWPEHSPETRLQALYLGTRVLLAEDEPVSREVAVGLLEQAGLAVDVADNGQQALDLARQNRYALILMDVQMPKLNGIDASRAILANSLNRTTPILAMTANVFDDDRQRCREAGMVDHIAKPVDPEQLYATLLGWLEKRAG